MANQPPPKASRAKKKVSWTHIMVLLLIAMFMLVSLPTVILIAFGLLPTGVAYLIDRSYQHSATFSVGSLNAAGLFPYLLELWTDYNTMDYVLAKMADVFAIAIIYGGAAFGWMLFTSLPPIVAGFYAVVNKQQIAALKSQQKKLIDEWGTNVMDDAPPPKSDAPEENSGMAKFDADMNASGKSGDGIGGGTVEELDLS